MLRPKKHPIGCVDDDVKFTLKSQLIAATVESLFWKCKG